MKNIKLRIVYLILCSALLLFALFMLAVNLIIPAHFVREAKKALISEAEYQNRTIPYTDDGSFFDDEWNDTEEHFLTPSIVFLADPERKVIEAYDVWKEKKNYGKISMGVVRTTYLIDEQGVIIKANDKVKAADDPENMLKELEG